jgi:hypothetical protein
MFSVDFGWLPGLVVGSLLGGWRVGSWVRSACWVQLWRQTTFELILTVSEYRNETVSE